MPVVCGLITDVSGLLVTSGSKKLARSVAMPKRSELRITKRTVDALTVDTKDTLFWDRDRDRDLAGFGVRVHATGRKLYVVQSRGPTGLKRVTLGRHGELATDEARKQAAVVIDRIKRGEDPMPAPPAPEPTVADLAEHFMRVHVKVNCKPSTAATYRGHLDCHNLPALGELALGAVGRGEVAALHHRLRDTPPTANAARVHHRSFHPLASPSFTAGVPSLHPRRWSSPHIRSMA